MSTFLKKFIIFIAVIVLILFLALIIAAWSLGAFDSVQVSETLSGPYYFISYDSTSGYGDLSVNIQAIKKSPVFTAGIKPVSAAMIYSNPMMTPLNEVQVKGGVIVSDSIQVSAPLHLTVINKRPVVSATLEANPSIAIFKTYPALSEWLRKNDRKYKFELPFIEIYYNSDKVTVEMPILPVKTNSSR